MTNKHNQQGFSLFMVMIMMIVIALLVVITSQTTSTESRLSANEADRKYALSEAEVGLRDGEEFLNKVYTDIIKAGTSGTGGVGYTFRTSCQGSDDKSRGLCSPVENVEVIRKTEEHFKIERDPKNRTPAWERPNIFEKSNNSSREAHNGKSRYIIEYMGQREESGSSAIHDYFRITSRAHGQNENTVVTLQSYVEMTRTN